MRLICPNEHCHKRLRIPDAGLGRTGKCPACGKLFRARKGGVSAARAAVRAPAVAPLAKPVPVAADKPRVAPAAAVPRRDQHNEHLRQVFVSLGISSTDLAECASCRLLLFRAAPDIAEGMRLLVALKRSPAAVAAFITVLSSLLGKEHIKVPENAAEMVFFLDQFTLVRCARCQNLLCPACAGGRKVPDGCRLCGKTPARA
jgi:uncharacterized C2H2 Zn-finger protein